jgi:hypothetical protein
MTNTGRAPVSSVPDAASDEALKQESERAAGIPLEELLVRLERATEPDRELDFQIMGVLNWPKGGWKVRRLGNANNPWNFEWTWSLLRETTAPHVVSYTDAPRYTSSVDAALMLVLQDKHWRICTMTGLTRAIVCDPNAALSLKTSPTAWHGATAAIALCIAALKARITDPAMTAPPPAQSGDPS